jgi:hypothetical protein
MAVTSSKKSTDLNKLATLDEPTEATAPDDKSANKKASISDAPVTDESVADSHGAVDPIAIALSNRPAEHGLPAFPL